MYAYNTRWGVVYAYNTRWGVMGNAQKDHKEVREELGKVLADINLL